MKQNSFPFGLIFEIFKANFYCSKVVQPLGFYLQIVYDFVMAISFPPYQTFHPLHELPDFSTPNLLWSIAITFNLQWSHGSRDGSERING